MESGYQGCKHTSDQSSTKFHSKSPWLVVLSLKGIVTKVIGFSTRYVIITQAYTATGATYVASHQGGKKPSNQSRTKFHGNFPFSANLVAGYQQII